MREAGMEKVGDLIKRAMLDPDVAGRASMKSAPITCALTLQLHANLPWGSSTRRNPKRASRTSGGG
jgi:hypothetical protein